MRRSLLGIIVAASVVFASLAGGCSIKNEKSDRLSIVATSFPPYDFARAVVGDTADITMLLSTGAEAHSYEPTPLDIAKIQSCDVFVCIGGEDEVWVDKILDSIDTSEITVKRKRLQERRNPVIITIMSMSTNIITMMRRVRIRSARKMQTVISGLLRKMLSDVLRESKKPYAEITVKMRRSIVKTLLNIRTGFVGLTKNLMKWSEMLRKIR